MTKRTRIALVGATGLVGHEILQLSIGREDLRIVAIARREVPLPPGARMEVFVAEPGKWGEVLEAVRPDVLVSALGTTIRKVGGDKDAFRAVDRDLVLETARAAVDAGVERCVAVSSVGADSHSRNFYLSVKGQAEAGLAKAGFKRLDVLRPGLLRGRRSGDPRPAERLGMAFGPVANAFLHGQARRYRAIGAQKVAEAALALALRKTQGRFVHEYDGIARAAQMLPRLDTAE